MSGYTIRRYEPRDARAVLAMADRLTVGVAPWRDAGAVRTAVRGWVSGALSGDPITGDPVWVAELDGAVVGFVHAGERTHFSGERDGYVGELVVAEPAARRGIGRALLAAAEDWAAGRGLRRLSLETGAANTTARAFYAALGYQEEDVRLSRSIAPRTGS